MADCLSFQARARLELREEATEQDARNVVEIMKFRYKGKISHDSVSLCVVNG